MPASRTVPRETVKTSRRPGLTESSPARRRAAEASSTASPASPEWMTERWKLEVQAEARRRLKKSIQGVAGGR